MSRLSSKYNALLNTATKQWLGINTNSSGLLGLCGMTNTPEVDVTCLREPASDSEKFDFARQFAASVLPELKRMASQARTTYDREIMIPLRRRNNAPIVRAQKWSLAMLTLLVISGASLYALIQAPRGFANCPERQTNSTTGKTYHEDEPCKTLVWLTLLIPAIFFSVFMLLYKGGCDAFQNCQALTEQPSIDLDDFDLSTTDAEKLNKLITLTKVEFGDNQNYKDIQSVIDYFEIVLAAGNRYQQLVDELNSKQQQLRQLVPQQQNNTVYQTVFTTSATPLLNTHVSDYNTEQARTLKLSEEIERLKTEKRSLAARLGSAYQNIHDKAFPEIGSQFNQSCVVQL